MVVAENVTQNLERHTAPAPAADALPRDSALAPQTASRRTTPGRQLCPGRVQSTRQRGGPAADRGLPHGMAGLSPGRHKEHRRRLAQVQTHLRRPQQDERRAGGPTVRTDAGGPQRPRRGRIN
ncbi:hypothetical protein KL938_004911 [Ogataea parapolymorpha]|nr:hypothetical protein KL938_004911 [Ogataea parapolymorpha]